MITRFLDINDVIRTNANSNVKSEFLANAIFLHDKKGSFSANVVTLASVPL